MSEIKKSFVPFFAKIALVILGIGMGLSLIELLLRADPNLVPNEVRVNPPVRRVQVYIDNMYQIKLSNGDLFHWMHGKIAPLSPEQDKVVANIHLTTDEYGFRNMLPEKENYDVVALGDSFTVAGNVATPWPQKMAEGTGMDVLNLGQAGTGPQEELEVLQEYGLAKRPQWVIMAYFEGNDLYDAAAYEQANPFILPRFGKYILTQGIANWRENGEGKAQATPNANYLYPFTVTINDTELKIAFFSSYISWLSISDEIIEPSQNFRLVRETILQAQMLSAEAGARFLLVYIPTKAHIYLPYLNDPETLAHIFTDVPTLELDDSGFLQFTNQRITAELAIQTLDDQTHLLAHFASDQNINYLDLTPYFQEEAGMGTELYYPFDTHWNQYGHNLAAVTIAEYIGDMLPAAENSKPDK